MKKTLLFLILLSSTLLGRDNPFKPATNIESISNNNQKKFYKFKKDELRLPSSARVIKSVKIVYTNIDGSTGEVSKDIERSIDWHEPIVFTHNNQLKEIEGEDFREIELKNTKFIEIFFLDKDFKIKTPFKIKQHFFETKPFRVVLDFKGEISKEKIEKTLKERYFKKVTITTHRDFFRLVLELDSYYEYLITEIDGGYMLGVR
ncbi:MAG: AMIN domain-containing protein [Campylobacterales bacterium]|nr:AMIN domain-containing protein [Campylobacterales bacterium]